MSLWTKRHALSVNDVYVAICAEVASIVFDGKIWIVCDARVRNRYSCITEILIFDPETEVFTKKFNANSEIRHDRIECLAADEKNLYMWRSPFDGRQKDFHLFKLDRATMDWESVMTINRRGYFTSIVIINQIMHILEVDEHPTNEVYLIHIDLQKREVVDIKTLVSTNGFGSWYGYLSFHNNKLFLMEAKKNLRNVYEIQNDELKEIAHEENSNESIHFFDENVSVSSDKTFKVHNFDFDTLSWLSEVNNPLWMKDYGDACTIKSCVKANGSIFLILRLKKKKSAFLLELHKLDLHPTLASISLADLTNRLSRKNAARKLDEVKEQLPNNLRTQLEKLVEWKKSAKRK